jgi:predicted RNA binding protein YcfA (HicA-like mRNA interferase family)
MWENPSQQKAASIPDWQGKDLKKGTLRGILKQLGINYKDFRNK